LGRQREGGSQASQPGFQAHRKLLARTGLGRSDASKGFKRQRMIRKSGQRFSEKVMLKQKDRAR
jgi:hypothetical protein